LLALIVNKDYFSVKLVAHHSCLKIRRDFSNTEL